MVDAPSSPEQVEVVGLCGPLNGPSFRYRGATIDADPGGTLFQVALPGLWIDGWKGRCTIWDALALVDHAVRTAAERWASSSAEPWPSDQEVGGLLEGGS